MARKIIGVTVGTPMNPQTMIEKTEQAKQIETNTQNISKLNEEIGDLQNEIDIQQNEIDDLMSYIASMTVSPQSVIDGVSDVVSKAISRGNDNVLRFIISTDAHQKNDHKLITKGNQELGQACGEILKILDVDFVSNLGDSSWGSYNNTTEEVREQLTRFNRYYKPYVRDWQELNCEGNHDDANYSMRDNDGDGVVSSTYKLTPTEIYSLIYARNKNVVYDTEHYIDGYCYKDFENLKVRVICLNTEQGTGDGGVVEDYQLAWLEEVALNITDKTDWSVITLAHHPFSYGTTSLNAVVEIINTFINSGGKYIGHFHGHAHAFSVVKMQRKVNSVYTDINAYEICIPNACYTRNNQYLGNSNTRLARYSTETTYNKFDEDGKRTSFNLVTIDLDDGIIYADNYGVGIDRIVSYGDKEVYTITRNTTNCISSSSSTVIVEGNSYTENITVNDGYIMDSVVVTMGGTDITSSVYANGVITISKVTGDIVITANAILYVEPTYTNQIPISTDTDGSVYNGVGYKENTYLSSGVPTSRSGIDCSGFIPIGCGSSKDASGEQVIRLNNVSFDKTNNSRFSLYTSNKTHIQTLYGTHLDSNNYNIAIPHEIDANSKVIYIDITAISAHLRDYIGKDATAYFRISCPNIDGNSIVTVNEEITD